MEQARIIRIVIREPQPGWWQVVKDQARKEQRLLGGLVVVALNHYLTTQAQQSKEVTQ